MSVEQIEMILDKMDIPYRYHHFTQKEMKDINLPIIVWIIPGTSNFYADVHIIRSENWILNCTQKKKIGN